MMKSTVLLLAVLATLAYSRTISDVRHPPRIGHDSPVLKVLRNRLSKEEVEQFDQFTGFMQKYNKRYQHVGEVHQRLANFLDNLKQVATSQANERGTAKHGVTRFFDMTREEFRQSFANLKLPKEKLNSQKHDLTEAELARYASLKAPETVDWRSQGAVTKVKDQGFCGSCYVFAAIGAVEGQWFKKTGDLVSFSEEQILDCADWLYGCDGGWPLDVYSAIAMFGGVETQADYPYTATWGMTSRCKLNEQKFVGFVNGSRALPTGDEELIAKILSEEGPVEINIDADYIFDYDSGILDPAQKGGSHPEAVNHAVLAVGYGTENGVDYWIIKNSWSEWFGEKGYFRLRRGTDRLYIADTNPSLPLIY